MIIKGTQDNPRYFGSESAMFQGFNHEALNSPSILWICNIAVASLLGTPVHTVYSKCRNKKKCPLSIVLPSELRA